MIRQTIAGLIVLSPVALADPRASLGQVGAALVIAILVALCIGED
jgi:hypothetical protein